MVLEHGEHVVVPRHDPQVERGGVEDGLLAAGELEHRERVLALPGARRIEPDRGLLAHVLMPGLAAVEAASSPSRTCCQAAERGSIGSKCPPSSSTTRQSSSAVRARSA